ncbi:MAG TPA: ATP-binding protein [Candidatus Binatia bacterium]|jgi:signal transduction histidine kinase
MTTASNASRGRWRAASACATIAAAVIVAMCAWSALARIGRPFPGFFVWENGFVPAVGMPGWSGAAAGLPYHCWIEAVEGHSLVSVAEIDEAVAARPAGSPLLYSIEQEGHKSAVSVPTEIFGAAHFVVSTGIYLFDSIVLLLLAGVLFYAGGDDAGPRAVGWFALTQSLYLSTSIDLFGPYRFRELYFFFAGLTPTATLLMISRFPVERKIPRVENVALIVAAAASLAFGALSNDFFETSRTGLLLLDRSVHLAMAASALAAFAFFGWHYTAGRSEAVRRRCQVVLLASLGGFLPTMVFLTAFYVGGISLPFNALALPFVLFPLGIGYAVGKHDLFDVDTVVKRTIVYTMLSVAVFGIYSIAINGFDSLFEHATPVASRMAEGTIIVTLVVLFDPSRRRLQDTVNRLYDRRRWEYRDVVRSSVRTFSTLLDIDQLIPTVLHLVDETVQPTYACIYTIADAQAPRLRGGLLHPPGASPTVHVDREGAAAPEFRELAGLAASREVITRQEADAAGFEMFDAAVALGLALEGRPTGLLVVGPRRSAGLYTREDVDLLRTIAGQLAVAMQNADSYRTIEVLNRDLAGKNSELSTALDDLREAQDELVIKERLAAIGEIAGAVAHTIRNPLAGMRASAQQASIELAEHPVAELVDAFVRETDRLSSRIDSLLDFARPYHASPRDCALDDVARRAAAQVRGRAAQRGIEIDESEVHATTALVDPILFEQLAIELIANAVDASPNRGCVRVASGRENGTAWIEVCDNGAGIAPERRRQMFRMFYTTKAKGTGVGLATVKRIADAHQAGIEVGDAPGGGARFRISIPDRAA